MKLAPLDPDQFLVWAWRGTPKVPGCGPLTVDDVAFELQMPREAIRKDYVRLAAKVRRNQRLGLDPFHGIV